MDDKIKQLYDKTRANLLRWGVSEEEADEFMKEIMETADKNDDGSVKDDVEKAEENIEEKGADEQTEKDRVDESVGEQLKDDGKEDDQSAKDRVDESEGEEKANEKKNGPDGGPSLSDMDEVEEPAKEELPPEEPKEEATAEEPKQEDNTEIESLKAKIKTLEDENGNFKTALLELQKTVEKLQQKPVPVPESQKTKLDKYTRQYEN